MKLSRYDIFVFFTNGRVYELTKIYQTSLLTLAVTWPDLKVLPASQVSLNTEPLIVAQHIRRVQDGRV